MKIRFLFLSFFALWLCHCSGTEVGNGVQRDEATDSTGTAQESSAPEVAKDAATGTANISTISPYLIVACASPFAEAIDGSFADTTNQAIFKVANASDSSRNVTILATQQTLNIVPAPAASSPYAIKTLANSPALTCGPITSQTLSDGTTERHLTLSDSHELSWILDSGKVTSITHTDVSAKAETWTRIAD